jgi:hypothetical protein
MVGDPHQRHDREHTRKRAYMDGDEKHKYWNHNCAGQRLPWVKTHRGPCGWRAAFMMHGMRLFKPPWAVHQPVRPIKPCVMRRQIKEYRQRHIPERIIAKIAVNLRPAMVVPAPGNNASGDAIDGSRQQRPIYLAPDLRTQFVIQPRPHPLCDQCKQPTGQQIAHPDNQRHGKGGEQCGNEGLAQGAFHVTEPRYLPVVGLPAASFAGLKRARRMKALQAALSSWT